MRSSILSTLIIASTVSTALGAPTASSSFAVKPSNAETQAEASIDPRIARWAHMKVAFPDGLFPEDKGVLEDQRMQIVPMIAVDESSLPQPATVARKPVDKHQRIDIEPAYKHMGIVGDADEEDFLPVVQVAPLSPDMQHKMNQEHDASKSNVEQQNVPLVAGRPHRKYLGVSDSGEAQIMTLPNPAIAQDIDVAARNQQEESHASLQAKKIVGLDQHGKTRYVDIVSYSRGSK